MARFIGGFVVGVCVSCIGAGLWAHSAPMIATSTFFLFVCAGIILSTEGGNG